MLFKNAVKRMEKIGNVTFDRYNDAILVKDGYELSVSPNGRMHDLVDVAVIRVRRLTDQDDFLSDYHAGSFFKTLKSAIDFMYRRLNG